MSSIICSAVHRRLAREVQGPAPLSRSAAYSVYRLEISGNFEPKHTNVTDVKYVYLLRSRGYPGQLYVGMSANPRQRLDYHNGGSCRHTSKFRPWEIVYSEKYDNEADAVTRERQIKGWTRAKKERLILGDTIRLKELSKRRVY